MPRHKQVQLVEEVATVEEPKTVETPTQKDFLGIALMWKRNRHPNKDGDKKWRKLIPDSK